MSQFTVNAQRVDPYKHFKFRVVWDGRVVAGISRVSALRRVTDVVEHREGGGLNVAHRSPGLTRFEPITLERGVSHDPAFENWANLVWSPHGGAEVALKHFRKDIAIELYNEAGQLALRYKVYRCWVSEYMALAPLDAHDSGVALQQIVLQHEGWERDVDVPEPAET
ncbi:MAG: phage tail protein [Betaproteobacteria bacterium]|nr:phage tail protein [Betaproteobacteria bacterium]MDE2046825.1 phage tail protein [Betaproteobacteria bacterium]